MPQKIQGYYFVYSSFVMQIYPSQDVGLLNLILSSLSCLGLLSVWSLRLFKDAAHVSGSCMPV